jgi:hypothetical protein
MANPKIDWKDTLRLLAVAITSITGAGIVNSSGEPNERIAVLEIEVRQFKDALPEIRNSLHQIEKKQDSILITMEMRNESQ